MGEAVGYSTKSEGNEEIAVFKRNSDCKWMININGYQMCVIVAIFRILNRG